MRSKCFGQRISNSRYISTMLVLTFLVLSAFLVVFNSGTSQAVHLYTPTNDVSAQKNLDLTITYENLHVKSGGTLTFFAKVTERGFPVNGSSIVFRSDKPEICTFEYENNGITDADGLAVIHMVAFSEKGDIINITANAFLEGYMPAYYEIQEVTIEPPIILISNERISYLSIAGLVAVILIGLTETGKYGLFKTFVVPLYSRLRKDDLLDHFVRGQIYGYIMSHPGEHYNHIKNKLEVTNGTLSHHLRTLEFQGYIKSQRDGTYKRFYPTDMKIPRRKGIQLSDLQIGIVDAIRQSPGISQKEIAQREGISQQSVSYNLTVLERMGILDSTRDGIRKKYFITTEA